MRVSQLLVKCAALSVCASQAFAGGLFTPISLDSASVLPKGVRNARIGGFSTEVTDKYDGYGSIVPLGNGFNKPVTWNKLIDGRPDASERAQLRGALTAEGVDLNSAAGDARGLVNTRITSTVPVFAYGVTEKITLGMGIPVVYSATNVDTGWEARESFNRQIARLQTLGYEGRILALQNDLYNVVSTQIANYGYKPMVNEQQTSMGDVNLGMKAQLYQGKRTALALTSKVIVPTGRTADVDKVVDVAPGDGAFSAGVGIVSDFKLTQKLILTPSAGYLYQFATDKTVRVPRTADESISPDKDYNVNVKRGDIMSTGLALKSQFSETIGAGAGYSFQYKNPDSYQGSRYEPGRYRYLEQDTFQTMHSALISLTGSTVPLFKKKQFAIPLDASISFAHVIEGRNVGKLDVAIFDLAAYF